MNALPLLTYFGQPKGIEQTLIAARQAFPDLRVLSDTAQAPYMVNCEELKCADTDFFDSHYSHFSTNPEELERFCFLRWFYMRNYARSLHVSHIIHFEADVYICAEGKKIIERYGDLEFTIQGSSGHTSLMSMGALEEFCNFLLYFVEHGYKKHVLAVRERWNNNRPGGVCDLRALVDFYSKYPGRKSRHVPGISTSVNTEHGFRMGQETEIVEISMRRGHVLLFNEIDMEYVRFLTLHFQGERAKSILPHFHEFYEEHQYVATQELTVFALP